MARQAETKPSRRGLRRRLKAEELLRGPKWEWDFLHIAEAYAARLQRRGEVSLNDFAVEHGAAVKRDRNQGYLLQRAPRACALGGESGGWYRRAARRRVFANHGCALWPYAHGPALRGWFLPGGDGDG